MPKEDRIDQAKVEKAIPDWLPDSHIKLGLDLQGGIQLVLGVDTDEAVENKLNRVGTEVTRWAQDEKFNVKSAYVVKGQKKLRIEFESGVDPEKFREKFKEDFGSLEHVSSNSNFAEYRYNDTQM